MVGGSLNMYDWAVGAENGGWWGGESLDHPTGSILLLTHYIDKQMGQYGSFLGLEYLIGLDLFQI
jgi:hypothetical protein